VKNFRNNLIFVYLLSAILTSAKESVDLNAGWKFYRADVADATMASFDDTQWETVDLPHTWNGLDGHGGDGSYYRGIGWYRKQLDIPSSYEGQTFYLRFGAANMQTDVYVNGAFVGTHTGGYAAFMFDITDKLKAGQKNLIAIKVNNADTIVSPPLTGGFVYCGGITRGLELLVANPVHINPNEILDNAFTSGAIRVAQPGVIIKQSKVSETSADLNIRVLLKNATGKATVASVRVKITDAAGVKVKELTKRQTVPAGEVTDAELQTTLPHPHLWDGVNDPYLYRVDIELSVKGIVTDRLTQPLGLRYFTIDPDEGFFLNGKPYPLRGISLHEDRPGKSRAVFDSERKSDLDLLLETGANYFRLAHYQHGNYTYNYFDTAGVICWTEIPFVGNVGASEAEKTVFQPRAVSQLYELMRQHYNNPSVLFWGLGNEVYGTGVTDPTSTIQLLNEVVKSEDAYRSSTLATACHANEAERPRNFIPDVFGSNRYDGWYYNELPTFGVMMDSLHRKYPQARLGVSEYGAGANVAQHQEPPLRPKTAGNFHPEEYQNVFHEAYLKMINERPYIWGTSIWSGIDFEDIRNEGGLYATNDKGLVTRDRKVKKDVFYLYKANWNKKEPFVYITSRRFIERDTAYVPIKVYSNCERVALTVNGKLIGDKSSANHIFTWENIKLSEGDNSIEAKGVCGNATCNDEAMFRYKPKQPYVLPLPEQVLWQGQEQIMFLHFDPATWQGGHLDNHSTPLSRINPTRLDVNQWLDAAEAFDAKEIIFVAKHTGGFCWWQTETSEYSIKNTPYKGGKGDVLDELAKACFARGIRLGVYIYPGDDTWGAYVGGGGKTKDPSKQEGYNKVLRRQWEEVTSRYGKIIKEIWYDGSVIVPLEDIIRRNVPSPIVFQGPFANIRWVGNEKGVCPYPNWYTVKAGDALSGIATADNSDPDGDVYMPVEVNTVPRYHYWFWSPTNHNSLRSLDQMMDIYYQSVGRGGLFLLNAAPDTTGLIPEIDMELYRNFGKEIRRRFGNSLAETSGKGEQVELRLDKPSLIDHVIVQEELEMGQRVRRYYIEGLQNGKWTELAAGYSVGQKRIEHFAPTRVEAVRLRVTEASFPPLIKRLAVFNTGVKPERILANVEKIERNAGAIKIGADKDFEFDISPFIPFAEQYVVSVKQDRNVVKLEKVSLWLQGTETPGFATILSDGTARINITADPADMKAGSIVIKAKLAAKPDKECRLYVK